MIEGSIIWMPQTRKNPWNGGFSRRLPPMYGRSCCVPAAFLAFTPLGTEHMLGDTMQSEDGSDLLKLLRQGGFDFLDFGCSRGGSIKMGKTLFNGARGLGIDISPIKVEEAISAGYDALVHDIHKLPRQPLVRFVIMAHFLEHVPNRRDVVAFLRKAAVVSREFIFIRQPFFDADGYLFQNGFKLYWSDWRGHPNSMTSLDFFTALQPMRDENLIRDFSIHARGPILTSSDPTVHPVSSPINQHMYSPSLHPAKPPEIRFEFPVFTEVMVFITKATVDHSAPFDKVKFDKTIYDSRAAS